MNTPGFYDACKYEFRSAHDGLERVLSDGFFDPDREAIRSAFRLARKNLRSEQPSNDSEMGVLCSIIELEIRPAFNRVTEIEDRGEKKRVRKLFLEISKIRLALKAVVKKYMKSINEWEKMDLTQQDSAIENVRVNVCAYLGLPDPMPEKGTPDFDRVRGILLDVKLVDFKGLFGMTSLFSKNRKTASFDSYVTVMNLAFPEFDLGKGRRKEKRWKGDDLVINVKSAAYDAFGIPMITPAKGTDEWIAARALILEISHSDFKDKKIMNCFSALAHHKSVYDVLVLVYGKDYDLTDELNKKRNNGHIYAWKTKADTISSVRGAFIKQNGLNITSCKVGTSSWWELIQILSCTQKEFVNDYHLGAGIIDNKFFSSHISLMLECFVDAGLKRWHFEMWGRLIIDERVIGGLDSAPLQSDRDDYVMSMQRPQCLVDDLMVRFENVGFRSRHVSSEYFLVFSMCKLLKRLNQIGVWQPIGIEALWISICIENQQLLEYRFRSKGGDIADIDEYIKNSGFEFHQEPPADAAQ